jgi:hypothetical protein
MWRLQRIPVFEAAVINFHQSGDPRSWSCGHQGCRNDAICWASFPATKPA